MGAFFKATILLLVLITVASAQCFAACSLLSCANPVENRSDCHHKEQAGQSCGHQVFVSEVKPQIKAFLLDAGAPFAFALDASIMPPACVVNASGATAAPRGSVPASPTILRV